MVNIIRNDSESLGRFANRERNSRLKVAQSKNLVRRSLFSACLDK